MVLAFPVVIEGYTGPKRLVTTEGVIGPISRLLWEGPLIRLRSAPTQSKTVIVGAKPVGRLDTNTVPMTRRGVAPAGPVGWSVIG